MRTCFLTDFDCPKSEDSYLREWLLQEECPARWDRNCPRETSGRVSQRVDTEPPGER